jgi:glucokinase
MAGRARTIVGVDLGGTKIQTVALRGAQVLGSARVPTPQRGGAEAVIAALIDTIGASLEQAQADPSTLAAVGIGAPGEIDAAAGIVSHAANVPGFTEPVRLGPQVSKALGGVTVAIDNDVRVGALGEHRAGAGRPYRDVLGVWLGTGVGGGLILDGRLRDGRGAAGEIGHVMVKPNGRRCSCGRRGCLEAYAGRARMERRARKLVAQGHKTELFQIMQAQDKPRLTSGVYARALAHRDKLAEGLIADAAWALGVALAGAQNLLDLEAIVIGGGLGDKLGRPFVETAVEHMRPHLFVADHPPVVLPTELGDLSGAIGAAALAGARSLGRLHVGPAA